VKRDTPVHWSWFPSLSLASRGGSPRTRAWLRRALLSLRLRVLDAGPFVQRLFSVMAAACGLLALTPLLVLVALAMKLTSPGPLLFRQERIGKHGRRFLMFKLRTMHFEAEAMRPQLASDAGPKSVRFKMRHDPRVTPIGRVMRKYSIDELPQLWNVIRGDMTLVGPRPPLWSEVVQYDAYALRRLEVTQGLTCLWQIGGRSDLTFEEQVKLDINYIDRTRPAEEIRILAKTIPAVLSGRGAY
jgi:lipopolysaccharide/colanic/teichoic acid biosynthesis glycosyltransferase